MKFRPVEIMSLVLDVGERPRPSVVIWRKEFSGGENTVSQSLECRDTEGDITTSCLTIGGHVRAV
eukprot:8079876-Heterocapsa_arctica.AAC.1